MFFLLRVIYCISEEEKMLDAVNAYRATKGKPPYTRSAMLDKAAQEHTEYMASINAIQHNGPLGSESHRIRIMNQGYKLAIRNNGKPNSAENVAFNGKPGANYVNIMNRWKKSPKHNAAMLGDFTDIGIGYVMDPKGVQYWTQVFGVPEKGSDQDDRGGQDDGSGVAPGTEKEIPAFGGPDSISGVSKAALPRNPFSPDGNYRSLFGGFANLDAKSRMANLQRYMEATRGISMF